MRRRAGHDNITTTIGYVKTGEDVAGSIGEPFLPLPACLVSPEAVDVARATVWADDGTRKRYRPSKKADTVVSPGGFGG
jgi:hypothetical protein